MSDTREAMLRTIREAIGKAPDDYESIPRKYLSENTLDRDHCLNLFQERLHDYDAVLHYACPSEVALTIARVLTANGKKKLLVPEDFPEDWLPGDIEFVRDCELTFEQLEETDGVLTLCAVAIAETGTIVLQDAPGQGRRALTLIPDYHLCVVRAEQVMETVPQAFRFLRATRLLATTTISGPSATSDIEMTRVRGVHGPRSMEVVLIS